MKLVLSAAFAAVLLLSPLTAKAQTAPPAAPPASVNITLPDATTLYANAATAFGGGLSDTRISLDMKDTNVRDAFKKAFEAAKQEYEIDDDLPKDTKITLKVEKARLATVLDLLAQTAGVGWHTEVNKGKTRVHVGKKIASSASLYSSLAGRTLNLPKGATSIPYSQYRLAVPPNGSGLLYNYSTSEQRSTFTCPHCKGQATILQKKSQPSCPTCQRAFQAGWKVCPYDGANRPADPSAWKFCPICGKAVTSTETAFVSSDFTPLSAFSNYQRFPIGKTRVTPPLLFAPKQKS